MCVSAAIEDDLELGTLQFSIVERGADGLEQEYCSVNIESLAYSMAAKRREQGHSTRVIDNHA